MANENILVVDDDKIVGTAFRRELAENGYKVDSVLSGDEAVKAVNEKKFDLVFIDMVMPGKDGVETCKEIKRLSPDSILIFMTGNLHKNLVLKEMEFINAGGKVYYLYKPFAKRELYEVVQKALKDKENGN